MKKSLLFLIVSASLALNGALGWLLITSPHSPPPVATDPPTSSPPPSATALATQSKIDPDIWPSLQTDELPALVARLRATGFPPDVIRGILSARLGEIFIARRKALDPEEDTRPFWKTRILDAKRDLALRQLGREHGKLLHDLLGDDADDPMVQVYQQRRFDNLPPDKANQVRQILRDFDGKRSDILSAGTYLANREKLAGLEKAQHDVLAQTLTPAELVEYDLRNSNTANQLRYELTAFDTTEAEFRQIYQLKEAFSDRLGMMYGPSSPEQSRARAEAQKQLTEQIKAALGPVRGEEYVRATDSNYRQASQLVARLELPPETTNQIWSVQKDIQQRTQAINTDRSLPADQRAQQLAALADEAKTKITATLGEHGFQAYKQYGGQWMQMLKPREMPTGTTPGMIFSP